MLHYTGIAIRKLHGSYWTLKFEDKGFYEISVVDFNLSTDDEVSNEKNIYKFVSIDNTQGEVSVTTHVEFYNPVSGEFAFVAKVDNPSNLMDIS